MICPWPHCTVVALLRTHSSVLKLLPYYLKIMAINFKLFKKGNKKKENKINKSNHTFERIYIKEIKKNK